MRVGSLGRLTSSIIRITVRSFRFLLVLSLVTCLCLVEVEFSLKKVLVNSEGGTFEVV